MTVSEAATTLRTARQTIYRLIDSGYLTATPAPGPGKAIKVNRASVQRYIHNSQQGGTPTAEIDPDVPRLYTLKEVAERTGFSLRTLERDCRAGHLLHVHRGRDRLMTAAHIRALIDKHVHQPTPDLDALAKTASQQAAQERLNRMLARDARRRSAGSSR